MIGDESLPPVIIGCLMVVPDLTMMEVMIPSVTPGSAVLLLRSAPVEEDIEEEDECDKLPVPVDGEPGNAGTLLLVEELMLDEENVWLLLLPMPLLVLRGRFAPDEEAAPDVMGVELLQALSGTRSTELP